MLNENQIGRAWERMLAAETRSLYFGDLAKRFNRRKQWITGISFFMSSGAAATALGSAPVWVPVALALMVAVATAYSIGVNLDRAVATMVKLHCSWSAIAADYDRLWNHAYDDDAEQVLEDIVRRERDLSELATTDAPNDQDLMGKWQEPFFDNTISRTHER